ncbi:MAG: response regulator transcription factor [Saprospiraceae bacterium]|nr:response regulator transcription factor [Saprospiraceae bacterium]
MIKCIAVDDEPRALEIIRNHISRVPFLSLVADFIDPMQAITYLSENPVDLLFLDINMPDLNGLQFARSIPSNPLVIFTTAHSEYAIESYEVEAIDYLLKPFDFARFFAAVSKAQERLKSEAPGSNNFFFVNSGTQKRRLFYDEIRYVEGEGNYVCYYTESGKVLVRASVKETKLLLPSNSFVQIHRSYIVSLQWIEKIEDNHVFVANTRIPISATLREPFLKLIDSLKR